VKLAAASLGVPAESVPKTSAYVVRPGEETHYTPVEWLQGYKLHGADSSFDLGSYYAYMWDPYPEMIQWQLLRLRATVESVGLTPRPFWVSEGCWEAIAPDSFGIERVDTVRAHILQETYASVQHANTIPGSPIEQFAWYSFTRRYMPDGPVGGDTTRWRRFGITGPDPGSTGFQKHATAHAYEQMSKLSRKSTFQRRLPPVHECDSVWVPILEYEDSLGRKYWIAWHPHDSAWDAFVRIPARSDIVDTVSTSVTGNPGTGPVQCQSDGWLEFQLDSVPFIVREHPVALRPDLVVDSVKIAPLQPSPGQMLTITAWVRNHGTRATPTLGLIPMPTKVEFSGNGTLVGLNQHPAVIGVGQTVSVSVDLSDLPLSWVQGVLWEAKANPQQEYVEFGTDDNSGYGYTSIPQQ
jgi:hypothetical protein